MGQDASTFGRMTDPYLYRVLNVPASRVVFTPMQPPPRASLGRVPPNRGVRCRGLIGLGNDDVEVIRNASPIVIEHGVENPLLMGGGENLQRSEGNANDRVAAFPLNRIGHRQRGGGQLAIESAFGGTLRGAIGLHQEQCP